MKQKLLAMLLALTSLTAWAEDYSLKINGVTVTSSIAGNLSAISGVSGTASYDAATSTLNLYNATISGGIISNLPSLTVNVMGQNSITATSSYAGILFNGSDAMICGTGTLNVTSNSYSILYAGGQTLTIRDCTLNLYGRDEGINDDGEYGEKLVVDNATLYVKKGYYDTPICMTYLELHYCRLATPDWPDFTYTTNGHLTRNGTTWGGDILIEPDGSIAQSAEQEIRLNTSRYDVSGNGRVTLEDLTLMANALVGRVNYPVTNLTVSPTAKNVLKNHTTQLSATITPSNADYSALRWSTSDSRVATVSATGLVTGIRAGTCTISATTLDGSNITRSCALTVKDLTTQGFVDLGLPSGTLWAACNLGASSPEQAGNYYAWGETAPKEDYSWDNYFDTTNGGSSFITFKNSGGLTELNDAHDPATSLADGAATPTKTQWDELHDNCNAQWETLNGVYGRTFTSKIAGYTDNSIFIPAAGIMRGTRLIGYSSSADYWLRELSPESDSKAAYFTFHSGAFGSSYEQRYQGQPIRAVFNP